MISKKTIFKKAKKTLSTLLLSSFFLLGVSCVNDEEDVEVIGEEALVFVSKSTSSVELDINPNLVSATAAHVSYPASNAVDGSVENSTRWAGFGSDVDYNIDLENPALIDYLNIAFSGSGRAYEFVVYTSNDESTWTQVGNKISNGTTGFEEFDVTDSTARYIRVNFQGSNVNEWNNVKEIQVFGTASTNECTYDMSDSSNIALGKPTTQTSTAYNGYSCRAVDGNTSGVYGEGSVSHTNSDDGNSWTVYLGEDYDLGNVVIWNRTDCCEDRLSDFYIVTYDEAGNRTHWKRYQTIPDPSFTVDLTGVKASRLTIYDRSQDGQPLALAEVQIYEEVVEDAAEETVVWENWYLSVPIDRGDGSATSIYYDDIEAMNLTSEEQEYFTLNSDGSYKMKTNFTRHTTSGEKDIDGGSYCRTELREYYRGIQSTSDNWSMNSGTHIMESTMKMESIGGDGRTYVGQIHGYPTDDLSGSPATVKVQWNNENIVLEYYTKDGVSDGEWTSSNDIAVTVAEVGYEKFTIKIKIEDGKLYLAVVCNAKNVNTGYVEYYDYDANGYEYDNYFKTGNYFKWNDDKTETSEVTLYGVSTYHD